MFFFHIVGRHDYKKKCKGRHVTIGLSRTMSLTLVGTVCAVSPHVYAGWTLLNRSYSLFCVVIFCGYVCIYVCECVYVYIFLCAIFVCIMGARVRACVCERERERKCQDKLPTRQKLSRNVFELIWQRGVGALLLYMDSLYSNSNSKYVIVNCNHNNSTEICLRSHWSALPHEQFS